MVLGCFSPVEKIRRGQLPHTSPAYWLKRAFEIGTLPKPAGTLWHGFRRKWATDRRHFPLKDVATAGGWSDVQTMITCYQQPDAEMMRAVVDLAKPPDPARTAAKAAAK